MMAAVDESAGRPVGPDYVLRLSVLNRVLKLRAPWVLKQLMIEESPSFQSELLKLRLRTLPALGGLPDVGEHQARGGPQNHAPPHQKAPEAPDAPPSPSSGSPKFYA